MVIALNICFHTLLYLVLTSAVTYRCVEGSLCSRGGEFACAVMGYFVSEWTSSPTVQ